MRECSAYIYVYVSLWPHLNITNHQIQKITTKTTTTTKKKIQVTMRRKEDYWHVVYCYVEFELD